MVETLKVRRFDDMGTTEHNAMEQLLVIPEVEFEKCFQQLSQTWNVYTLKKINLSSLYDILVFAESVSIPLLSDIVKM